MAATFFRNLINAETAHPSSGQAFAGLLSGTSKSACAAQLSNLPIGPCGNNPAAAVAVLLADVATLTSGVPVTWQLPSHGIIG